MKLRSSLRTCVLALVPTGALTLEVLTATPTITEPPTPTKLLRRATIGLGTCGFHDELPVACDSGEQCTMTEVSSSRYMGCCSQNDRCQVYTMCIGKGDQDEDDEVVRSRVLTCPDIRSSSECETLVWPDLTATSFICGASERVKTVDLTPTTTSTSTPPGDNQNPKPTESSAPSPPGDDSDETPGMGELSTAARIGIGVGSGLVGAILVACGGFACYRRILEGRARRRDNVAYDAVAVNDKAS